MLLKSLISFAVVVILRTIAGGYSGAMAVHLPATGGLTSQVGLSRD